MNIVITGAGGQLGRDLVRVLTPFHDIAALNRQQLDVTDERSVFEAVASIRPDAIIHTAAYTGVDQAERELERAYETNAFGTRNVALAAQRAGAKLLYVSTDYVFDGQKKSAYTERDRTNPISVYGNSKLHGEKFVEIISDRYFIVRTSWLYGRHGPNFVTKVLAQAERGGPLKMVADQFGSPTYTMDLVSFIHELLETEKYGVYHAANRGCCSRYEFAQHILQEAGFGSRVKLEPVSASELVAPAARPEHSVFDDVAIRSNGLTPFRDWKAALTDFILNDLRYDAARKGGDDA